MEKIADSETLAGNLEGSHSKAQDILIVDDTPNNLRLLSKILANHGYNVRKAMNGVMALNAINNLPPDLILLDIMMPEMDGYEVCKQLKSNQETADIPIIFLSALNDMRDKIEAFKVGAIDYITKPFVAEEVLIRVENKLALRAAEKAIRQMNIKLEKMVLERTRELEIANARLLEMALYDSLTGLPNRVLFLQHLQELLNRAKVDQDYKFAVFFIDCDRFKLINDSLGHSVGDELLVELAKRFQYFLTKNDTIARLGGDEFAILLPEVVDHNLAKQVAQKIIDSMNEPFCLKRNEVFINVSIGIAMGDKCYEKPEYLLRDADLAMYRAKSLGKARYHVFDPEMHAAALSTLQMESDLRKAIDKHELILHYQPIIHLITGKITGLEALVRWQHPQRGFLGPDMFIPLAEETGLISSIGSWVLQEACGQLHNWRERGMVNNYLTMSVNLSTRQFSQPNLIEKIDKILLDSKLEPQCLKLEITETAIMDDTKLAANVLRQLKERKIQLSIDDFGTGYSSLSYLHSLPIDIIKVDKSFVRVLDSKNANLGLVPAILSIAQILKMSAIAEGIETTQQLSLLRELECNYGQGYLFSKPLAPQQVVDLIQSDPYW